MRTEKSYVLDPADVECGENREVCEVCCAHALIVFTRITRIIDFGVVCLSTVFNTKSDGSWVISNGSWVTYQMGQGVMGQFQ